MHTGFIALALMCLGTQGFDLKDVIILQGGTGRSTFQVTRVPGHCWTVHGQLTRGGNFDDYLRPKSLVVTLDGSEIARADPTGKAEISAIVCPSGKVEIICTLKAEDGPFTLQSSMYVL